jgi:hypothetical protein
MLSANSNEPTRLFAPIGKSCQDLSGRRAELRGECGQDVIQIGHDIGLASSAQHTGIKADRCTAVGVRRNPMSAPEQIGTWWIG